MSNLPTSPIIVPANPNKEGMGSGMNGGGNDSVIGICTDEPNPKKTDWPRIIIAGTANPLGGQVALQSLVEYGFGVFSASPVAFAPADTQAGPEEIYATDVGASGWDLTNKTEGYTTEVGDWLWGAVAATSEPTCKVYECDAYDNAVLASTADTYWLMTDGDFNSTGEEFARAKGAIPLASSAGIAMDGPRLLDGACSAENSMSRTGNVTHAIATTGFNTDMVFTMSILIGGDTKGTTFHIRQRSGDDVNVGFPYGNNVDLRLRFEQLAGSTEFRIDDFRVNGSEKCILSIAYNSSTGDYVLYKNWDITQSGNVPWVDAPVTSPQLTYTAGGDTGNYCRAIYWDHKIDPTEAETLAQAWLQNQSDFTDPNPNCVPP